MSKKVLFSLAYDVDLEGHLVKTYGKFSDYKVLKKSLDARGANRGRKPKYNYQVEVWKRGEVREDIKEEFPFIEKRGLNPIVVGAGPAGLFCALRLSEYGVKGVILERGESAAKRMKSIAKFWRAGDLNEESNVCFGEGGAGLFSDGKLITRVKSPYNQYVMDWFVKLGAPSSTAYLKDPHLGSNKIRKVLENLSKILMARGWQIRTETKVEGLITHKCGEKRSAIEGVILASGEKLFSPCVVLATGHSARDIYQHLYDMGVKMSAKDFSVGVRIEHPRSLIDHSQYGDYPWQQDIGAARYRLSYENKKTKRGCYSFCMCPGGYVLSSGTEQDGLVVNGMSNSSCSSPWSNSALVVTIKDGVDFFAQKDLLAGMKYQRKIEVMAHRMMRDAGKIKELPALAVTDFLEDKVTRGPDLRSSTPSKVFSAQISELFSTAVKEQLKDALVHFDRNIKGYAGTKGILIAPETRTSAPLSIDRNKDTLDSKSHEGLYPCGEGAGYAGGITSAGIDGIKVAIALLNKYFLKKD